MSSRSLILVNNDDEQGLPDDAADDSDATAVIPATSGSVSGSAVATPVDDDLAEITLHKISSGLTSGTVSIDLSDASAVRLFKSDGTELTNLSLDLANPSANAYLAGLTSGDVNVWIEGRTKDSDFTFAEVLKDAAGNELARDDVHMMIAEWTFMGSDGAEITEVTNFPEQDLIGLANDDPDAAIPDSSQYFKIHIDGLPTADVQSVRVTSASYDSDYYDDNFDTNSTTTESRNFALLYSSGIPDEVLTNSQRQSISETLELNAVHNAAAKAVATTKARDKQQRDLSKLNPKDKAHALLDEAEDLHKDKLYYVPAGIKNLFSTLHWGVNQVDVAESKSVGGSNGASAKYRDVKDQLIISTSPTWKDVVHETVHAVDDKKDWYITTWSTINKAEALAYGTEWLLAAAQDGTLNLAAMETRNFTTATEAQQCWDAAWKQLQNATISVPIAYEDFTGSHPRPMTAADVADIAAKLGLKFSASALLPLYNQMLQAKGFAANSLTNNFTFTLAAPFQ